MRPTVRPTLRRALHRALRLPVDGRVDRAPGRASARPGRRPALAARVAALALAASALALPAAPLAAQAPGAEPPDEAELRTFALAWREMVDIQRTLEGNLEAAPESEHPQLRGMAQLEFQDVIDELPISMRRYTEIGRMLDGDAELRARLRAVLEELEREGGQ